MKKAFTILPIVSYCNAVNISSYLLRANLYPLERQVCCYKRGNPRCFVCENVEETDTFCSTGTGESFKMNYHLVCNGKCLIYLLTFKFVKSSILMRQLTDLNSDGTAIKRVILK